MKSFIICLVSISVLFACGTEKKEVVTNSIAQDLKSTKAATDTIIEQTMFKVTDDSLSVLKWTGSTFIKSHFGTVNFKGALGVAKGKLVSGDLTFDMNTISTLDLKGKGKQKLDKHLKNEDFFDVKNFPNAHLKIKSFDGENLIAELTIKEITKEISFPANLEIKENSLSGNANFTINRTEYGVLHNAKNFYKIAKDRIISDDIEFNVSIKAIK